MTITTRAGKGSALTFEELDENFTFLLGRTNSLSAIVTASLDNDGEAGAGTGIQFHVANLAQGSEEDANINLSKFLDADGNAASSASLYPVITSVELGITTATASGSGGLTYSSTNKQFTFTPPDLTSFLTSSSSISSSQLPSISLTSVTTVADEAAVAALSSSTQEGDVVLQTTGTKSYVRNSGTAGTIADFTELLTPDSDTTYAISIEQTGGNDTDPTLNLTPNQGTADTVTIKGGGATTVSRTDSGESVTITSTNTTYDSKAVENSLSSVTPAVTDVTNDVVTTNGAHTINDGTIIRVSETNDDTGLTLGEYTVSNTNKSGGTFTLVGVGTETTLSGANFHILNNDNPKIQLIGSDGTNDHITLTGGSNTTVTRNNDTNITIDGIGDTSYDFNADKSSDVNLPSMSSVSSDVVTFSGNHGLSDGDLVRVENAGVSGINTGDFTVSSQNGSNQFTATGIGSATGSLFSVIMTQISNSNPDLRLVGSDSTTDRVQVRGTGQVTVTRSSNELITIASSPSGTSTAIQKGDGAGGFSDATAGTDYSTLSTGTSTAILKGDGSGGFSDASAGTDYSTLAIGTSNTTALAGDTVVDNLLLEIPKSSNALNAGDKSWLKVATVTIDARYEYYSAQLAVVGTGADEGVANEKILAIRVKQQADMGQAPLVDIDIYNNGNEDYDFGHVVAVNSATETRVDIYFRPDGPNSGAEVYKMADTVTATVAWSSTGNSYATSAPANFVQGGAHQQWHSGNQAGIFGNLNGVLQANGSGVLSVATIPVDLTSAGTGTVHADNYTDTNTTYAISCVDGDATTEEKIRLTAGGSGSGTDDVVLAAGTGLSIARSNDKITFTNTVSGGDTNQNAFSNVAVNGQTTVAADSATDTLTLVAGSNITLATDANADSVTINASGGEITVQEDGSSLSTAATTLNFVGSGVTASGTGATKTITIANILPSSTSNLEITGSGHSADLSTTISPDVPTHAAAWNLNRTVTTSNSADVRDIFIVPDGSKILVVLGSDDRKIHSYSTSPNYHPQTLTLETTDVTSFQSGEHIYGIEYNGNGTKQFLLGSDSTSQVGSKIRTHNLSTAYDTVDNSSIVSDEIEFRHAAANTGYYAVAMDFSANGDTVFFLGADDGDAVLVSYALSSNYDITELTSGNSDVVYSVASYSGTSRVKNLTTLAGTANGPNFTGVSSGNEEANHKFDLSVESDGKTIYVLDGENNNIIYTYELSSANDLSTLSYFGARKVFGVDPDAMCISSDAANNVAFVGGSNNKIFQYDNDVSGTKITSSNTHFSGNVSANGELNVDGDVLMTGNVAVGTVTTDILNATTGPHTITATGDNDITISTASSGSAGTHGSTGVITIGTADQNVVNIGHGGNGLGYRQYVNIGTNVQATSVLALDIGEQTTASTPTTAVTQTINIGSNYGTYNQDISLYGDILLSPGKTEIAGGITSLNANVQARTITIGADHQTGDITLGLSTKSQTISIGNGATESGETHVINIGTQTGSGTKQLNLGEITGAFVVNPITAGTTTTIGGTTQTGTITLGRSTGSQTIDIASASNAGSKVSTVNIAQGGGTRTVNIASDSHSGSTTVVNLGNPIATANSTIQVRGNLSIDRPTYGSGATEYYDFFDHMGGVGALGSDGDWDISGTGLNALTEITIPATSHIGTMGKRGSLRMSCQSTSYNTSSTTKRNAEYYLGLQMKSKGTSVQSENLGAATYVSSPSSYNGLWSFPGNLTDKICAGFGGLANNSSAGGMTYGSAPITSAMYDSANNKTYIRVSSYYYYNTLGGSAVTAGNSTSFDVYYNPTEFKATGTWVSSMRADTYNSRTRMTVQPQSTHQMHHAFNLSIPKDTSKTELRLIFDYSGSNTDLTAAVYAVEGTVMLEGSKV